MAAALPRAVYASVWVRKHGSLAYWRRLCPMLQDALLVHWGGVACRNGMGTCGSMPGLFIVTGRTHVAHLATCKGMTDGAE